MFDQTQQKTGTDIKVDTVEGTVAAAMHHPTVAMTDEGKALVAWQMLAAKENWNIKVRVFDGNGTPVTPTELTLHTDAKGDHINPSANVFQENQFLIVWEKHLKWEQYKDLEIIHQSIQAAIVNGSGEIGKSEFDIDAPAFTKKQNPKAVRLQQGGMVLWQVK